MDYYERLVPNALYIAIAAIVGVGVILGATLATMSAFSSGEVTYCYVELTGDHSQYQLQGHRDYRTDLTVGFYRDLTTAAQGAALIGCPIK